MPPRQLLLARSGHLTVPYRALSGAQNRDGWGSALA